MEQNHKENFLDFLANCRWEIEHDADDGIDCSTFHIDGRLEELVILLEAFGLRCHLERGESWADAITRYIEAANAPAPPEEPGEPMQQDVVPPKPIDLGEECDHLWVISPADKTTVMCSRCGGRYAQLIRYPASDHER